MNKKVTVKTEHGDIVYCVVNGESPIEKQLGNFWNTDGNGGLSTRLKNNQIQIVDYFHDELFAFFDILSIEDTELEVDYKWKQIIGDQDK